MLIFNRVMVSFSIIIINMAYNMYILYKYSNVIKHHKLILTKTKQLALGKQASERVDKEV